MASSRPVLIAGAGIGGLSAALAIARSGFSATVYDQAERLEEIGAGIQLSPNASRILASLGLGEALRPHIVVPEELNVMAASSGRVLARAPLGTAVEQRYGAPYWMIHRGDLQAVLFGAAQAQPDITLRLGVRIEGVARDTDGVIVAGRAAGRSIEERGIALIGADGLWSRIRHRLGDTAPPRFAHHTAWRTLIPADAVSTELSEPAINLLLGRRAHLVHYPVKGGRLINVVAIVRDEWTEPGWSAPGERAELLDHFPARRWPKPARALLLTPERWQKWALYDRPPLDRWGEGPVTLLGDAAHPMLPYLAQGAAMAIEDAAVLVASLAATSDVTAAFRHYEQQRQSRTARAQLAAQRNGRVYHMGGIAAFARSLALIAMGGDRLISHYDWLYGWKPA